MRVLGTNIRHGGTRQGTKLGKLIAAHHPNVIALSEAKISTPLTDLAPDGWQCHPSTLSDRNGSALLASKCEPRPIENDNELKGMTSAAEVSGWIVVSVYLPGRHTGRKPAAWKSLLRIATELAHTPAILIGDFNTGTPRDRTSTTALQCEAEFEALSSEIGWTDAWRLRNPEAVEHSWYSSSGNGFRLDHAFVSPAGMSRSESPVCFYDHGFRTSRATDHSAIVLDI